MLADTILLLKDLVSGELLPQARSLQILGTGARRRVYQLEPGLVLKLTSEEMGHGLEPAWCDKFLPLTCKVHAHGQCSVRLSESASAHQETTMSWLIQERFVAHMKDYVPQVGPGSPAVVQLLACFVCVICFLEASGAALADIGWENQSVKLDGPTNMMAPTFHDCERWSVWRTGTRMSNLPGFWATLEAFGLQEASGFLVPVCFPTSESCTVICHTPKQALHSWSISGSQLALT
ncbi:unnamed protein product [Symbiodinium natans]|uniref:Uncharacterized protein n=1 Tax=Symbiodinium natans TaxID=878477 RepID=A0A812QFG1_9DINO|nr:unnamed protein product [Symbiodinium natans]